MSAEAGAQENMYWKGEADSTETQEVKETIHSIVGTNSEYIRSRETALPLKTECLDGDYQPFADFNGTVLMGHST